MSNAQVRFWSGATVRYALGVISLRKCIPHRMLMFMQSRTIRIDVRMVFTITFAIVKAYVMACHVFYLASRIIRRREMA